MVEMGDGQVSKFRPSKVLHCADQRHTVGPTRDGDQHADLAPKALGPGLGELTFQIFASEIRQGAPV